MVYFLGNHPQMAELFRLVNYYNLPRLIHNPYDTSAQTPGEELLLWDAFCSDGQGLAVPCALVKFRPKVLGFRWKKWRCWENLDGKMGEI
jgi:hypothetical protein